MLNIQGLGNFTLGAGVDKTISIRNVILSHICIYTALTDLYLEVDYFGKSSNIKLVESALLGHLQDVAFPGARFPAGNKANFYQIPVGHISLQDDVLEVNLVSATGGAVAIVASEYFLSNDYLVKSGISSGSSKLYNNLRTAKKLLADDIGEAKVFEGDQKQVFDDLELEAIGGAYAPVNDTLTSCFFVRPNPEENSVSIEFTDTTKLVYYTQYIIQKNLIDFSQKKIVDRTQYMKSVSQNASAVGAVSNMKY